LLIREIPELASEYQAMVKDWGSETPGGHIVYADLLVPFIERLLSLPHENEAVLVRTFQFLETLSRDGDEYIRNVVGASVFEELAGKHLLEKARLFFGPTSRELSASL